MYLKFLFTHHKGKFTCVADFDKDEIKQEQKNAEKATNPTS